MPKDFSEKILAGFFQQKGWEKFQREIISPWKNLRPKEEEFADIYSSEEIRKNVKEVEKIKQSEDWKEKIGDKPLIMEYILMEGIESYDWLGPNAMVSPTAEYDDIKRGVDFVVSFQDEEGKRHYLAVDATTKEDIRLKKGFVFDRLEKGELTRLKYFRSTDAKDPKIGRLQTAKVVLGLPPDQLKELVEIVQENKKGLADHPTRTSVKEQIKTQIVEAIETIKKTRNPGPETNEMIDKHQSILALLED